MNALATVTRSKLTGNAVAVASGVPVQGRASTTTSHSLAFTSSWEPDLWGAVRRAVEAAADTAQADADFLALTRLSMQATMAQLYFQVRTLDLDQKVLNETVDAYQFSLKITLNRYNAGVAAKADVIQARSLLEAAQAQAIDNGVNRAAFEHAIAVLIGTPPSCFALPPKPLDTAPPKIPVNLPSELLERRPDIAQAERQMASANAEVGVAIAAYFPVLSLTAAVTSQGLGPLLELPAFGWAIGGQLAETIFDGGLRAANTAAARSNYDATVANYRQVVLSAFQDVEDNLATLRILAKEYAVQKRAVADARLAVKLVLNQYKSGTVAYTDVIVAQAILYKAEKSLADLSGQRMTATVALIKALGGGWQTKDPIKAGKAVSDFQ